MQFITNNANILFASTLDAGVDSLAARRSILIDVGTAQVTFGDRVGANNTTFSAFLNRTADLSPYELTVNAAKILAKADITTFEKQTYNGDVIISDNGSNGLTRLFLSEDPTIVFYGRIDDAVANTHTLIVKAITYNSVDVPIVKILKDVGSVAPLYSLTALTGRQDTSSITGLMSAIASDPTSFVGQLSIAGNVSTSGNQTYTSQAIQFGDPNAVTPNKLLFVTSGGVITFNVGVINAPLTMNGPVGGLLQFQLGGGSVTGTSLAALTSSGINYQMVLPPSAIDATDIYAPMRKSFKPDLIDITDVLGDVAVGALESANDCDKGNAADSECKAISK
jgi:hypothetical protein